MKILIADDDDISRTLLRNALEQSGHEVIEAADGAEALESLRANHCRMLISDWEMPGMNGLELTEAIRNGDLTNYVYIILLTHRDRTEDIVQGLSCEADDFITKPFQPAELTVRVRAGERVLALETRDLAIFTLAKLAESRDPETGAHLERVRHYCRELALKAAVFAEFKDTIDHHFVRMIYLTAPLHDIGKLAIPDSILLKPGRLSDREFQIMKTHTIRGAESLQAAIDQHPDADFLHMARDIAAYHHEHFDGNGYPRGLTGDAIPLSARIMSLADVYDALTSRRVYKDAYRQEVAESIIEEGNGTHFDPRIVEAFGQLKDRFDQIRRESSD